MRAEHTLPLEPVPSTWAAIKTLVDGHRRFWITTHVHPDGDGLSSMLMIRALLQKLGKEALCVLDDSIPAKFDFLHGIDQVRTDVESAMPFAPEVVFVVDASCRHRLGRVESLVFNGVPVVNIDHHAGNDRFGTVNLVDGEAGSAAEVVYPMLSLWPVAITPEMAALVYTGIICDTGRFIFPSTSAKALAIGAEMVRLGASPSDIAEKVYYRSSQATIRGLSQALSTLDFHFEGKAASMSLSHPFIQANGPIDTEGFVDHLLAIDGTEVEFFMVERTPGQFRVSFRSKNHVNVDAVAQAFGGGGHRRAAGATLCGELDSVRSRILDMLGGFLA